MADGKMPDFIKKKIDAKKGADSESASESTDSASDSPAVDAAAKKKLGPLAAWAKKKAG